MFDMPLTPSAPVAAMRAHNISRATVASPAECPALPASAARDFCFLILAAARSMLFILTRPMPEPVHQPIPIQRVHPRSQSGACVAVRGVRSGRRTVVSQVGTITRFTTIQPSTDPEFVQLREAVQTTIPYEREFTSWRDTLPSAIRARGAALLLIAF